MNLPLPAQYFIIGILGMLFSTVMVLRSLKQKARVANVIFSEGKALKDDWLTPVSSFIVLLICMFFIPTIPKNWNPALPLLLFATIGYMGNDIASRVFSVTNKRINAAIDYKTDIADTVNGTLGTPTPAAKPPNP